MLMLLLSLEPHNTFLLWSLDRQRVVAKANSVAVWTSTARAVAARSATAAFARILLHQYEAVRSGLPSIFPYSISSSVP
jgi:hypothetical protein